MLSGRSDKAERRASKTQSLYVATPSSSTLPLQHLPSQAHLTTTPSSASTNTPKSPRKTRPFSMMFLHPQEELAKQHSHHLGQDAFPPDQNTLHESDEDGQTDSTSLAALDYGESDLKEADSDTRMLIAHLTDLDSGLPILLERVKQNLHSCKDLVSFLKKRAVMEAEYGANILKLASGMRDSIRQQEGPVSSHHKQGSYGECWSSILEMHERMGNNRLELSRDLQVVSEELSTIYKETDRSRKQFKEAGAKQERIVQEQEQNLEKAKLKYDTLTEEWERAILQKIADPSAPKKTMTKAMTMNIFRQPKSVGQLHRQEEEAKIKAGAAHDQYKIQLSKTNDIRQYYFNHALPSILKNLKDTIDESDLSLQYYLIRYGYMAEDYVMKDAIIINPIEDAELGLRDRVEMINKDTDLQVFIQAYSAKANPVVRSATPYQEYLMSAQAQAVINPRPIFGVDLAEQLIRDETDLPEIVVKCTEAIERYGMETTGIYRVSGITSATNRLRLAFDRDCSAVDLNSEENCGDVNSVASVLKTWFRELPEPLLTRRLYPEFIKAANIEDPQLQLMNLHECTNQLPDPNYATLKFLMCHLNRIQARQEVNKMGASNLGLIFGPTLTSTSTGGAVEDLADMGLQCRVIETLLTNYGAIFDIDGDEEEHEMAGHQDEDDGYSRVGMDDYASHTGGHYSYMNMSDNRYQGGINEEDGDQEHQHHAYGVREEDQDAFDSSEYRQYEANGAYGSAQGAMDSGDFGRDVGGSFASLDEGAHEAQFGRVPP